MNTTSGGHGPSAGLGSQIEAALRAVGITSERVSSWLGGPCGCAQRRDKLNALSAWTERVLSGRIHRARDYLNSIMGSKKDTP